MKITGIPAGTIDWSRVPESIHPGESGVAAVRSQQLGDIQLRLVLYTPGYEADHWCHKGHIVLVIEGEFVIEHQQGAVYHLTAGMTYHVADDDGPPHRLSSRTGATIFVVD